MDYSPTKIKLIIVLYLMLCLHLSITSITGSVVLIPPKNYTVFKNNASASFYCYGDGYVVAWYLNGTAYNAMHAQMGIRVVPNPPTGTMVSSTLYIPSTSNSTNNKTNNTEVFCKVADTTFTNIQTSVPANLTIQGPLDAPYNFSVAMSNTSFNLSWGAPFSLHVTGYPADIFNYTLCTNITIYGCKTIPSDPDCTFPRNCTSSVDFTEPSLNSTNKTIMDYGDTIVFIFAAINGAGIGNMSEYIYHINGTDSKVQVSPNTTETVRNTASTISYTNDSKTDLSIGAVRIGLISTAVVVIVVIIITFIIAAIRCSIMKRKAQFERNELTHVHADSSHADGCNYYSTQQTQVEDLYFMPVSDFRSTTSQDPDKSCIESGIQHQSNQEQFHCKGESSYADVLCVPVISISAPKQEVTYSEVRNTEAAQSVPVTQPSEQISSTPPPKYDNVVLPAESNKLEQTEPPKHMNEDRVKNSTMDVPQAYSNPYSKGGSRIDCDEYDEDVEEGVEDSIKDTPKVTSSPPSSGIRRRNPNQQRTESDGDEEGFEEEIKDFMKDDIPKAYLPSGNRSQHLRRTECDEDDDDDEEEIKDLVKDDIPKQYKYPSNNRSQRLCQRVDCDGDDEDIEGTTMDWMKKDMLQVSSSASHDSSQCQQCTEYDGDEENDWCNNSTTEKEATVPKQFTSGVLVKTGCDDSKQRTNHRTISEDIKYDDNSSFVFSFTHFKTEHIEGQNLPTSKESSMSDDASSDDERKTVEQSNWLMHWHSIIRPQYLRPVDMPILSTVVPSVNVKEQSFEKSCMYEETGCGIHGHVHVHDTLNADYCLKCATDNQTEQAEVALEVAGTDTATCLSMDESPRAFFKQYVESKIGAVGVGKTHLQHFLVHNPAEQCFSTGLADNPTKTISSSLEDDWFVFKNEKQHTGNTNAIKGSLDDVHRTQPQPAPMLPWFTVAVISKLLISLLLLMSGDIEENPGPEGPKGEDPTFTHKNVLNALKDVVEWKSLGVQLNISGPKIKEIDINNRGQVAECRYALVQFWLESDVSCSWKKLIDALKSIHKSVLAEEITRTYCPMYQDLDSMMKEYKRHVVTIIITGCIDVGKSSLIKILLDRSAKIKKIVKCYLVGIHVPGPDGPHKKGKGFRDYPVQCFSTGLAGNPIKDISSSLEDDWFVFKNKKQHTGNTNAVKGDLDDVHRTQPKPAPILSWLKDRMMEELVVGDPGVDKSLNTFFVCRAKIATESVKCYEMIRSLVDTLGTYLPHKKEIFFYDMYNNLQCFSTGQAKAISSSLDDDWFVFQDDKELTGNADTIKGGLDNVQPQPAPMLPRFTVAVISKLLISLLLLMSGDIEENPGPEGEDPTFTHKNVLNVLKDVVEWKSLGVQLDISALKMKEIDVNNQGQVTECTLDLVLVWLESDMSCSWKKLIDALEAIGKSVLAEEIISTYCPMYQDSMIKEYKTILFIGHTGVGKFTPISKFFCYGAKIETESVNCYETIHNLVGIPGPDGTHKKGKEFYDIYYNCTLQYFIIELPKAISSSLDGDWFVFQDDKDTDAIKGGLDDVHWTQPKPVAMFSWFPVAVISKLLISLLLLMSGDIEENPGPEGPEGEGNDERLKYSEFITTIVQYASDRITEDIKKKINTVCVIILACSENELRASAVEMIEEENIIQVDYKTGTKLYLGKLADCACGIVVTGQGKHSKSDVKEILKTCINAKLIISLGVTAGLGKSKLDDVLIATKIAHYDEGKVQNDGFFSDGETKNVYKIVEKIFSQAALFTWDFPCAINWRKSKYISGLIDSDPYLLDSKLWVDRMGITNAEAKGYEMEGHILQWIAEEEENRDLNFIIIKCVCDSANGSKSKEWQYTGAKAAASYTKTRLTMSETYKSSIVASHYLNISNEKEVKDHQSNTWKTYMQLVKANMVYSSPSNDRSFANANLICRPFQCPIFGDDENGWCQNSISKKEATVPQQFTSDVLVETGSVPQQFTCDKTGSCVWPFIHVQLQNEHSEGHTLPTSKESDISNDASSIDEGRIMEQGDLWNIIWTRTETNFGAAGVGKMRLQHFPMNDHPEQCFGTGLADDSIKDMFSSLEQHWVLLQIFIQLIGKAIKAMVSCYLKIMIGKEMKDQAKTWKTYIQAVKAIGGSVVFWLPLDVAYGALDVQALYAKGIVE